MISPTRLSPFLLVLAGTLLPAVAQSTDSAPETVIFEQPVLTGISGNFHVPLAEHKYPNDHPFNLLLWQPNPNQPDGTLVPTTWPAGDMTGFYPTPPLTDKEAAFRDAPGSSTLQIDGGTIGVYLKSSDLPVGTDFGKMMITPAYMLPKDLQIFPFAAPGSAIVEAMDLQIPVAKSASRPGSMAYVVSDLVLEDRTSRTRLSYEIVLFHMLPKAAPQPTPQRMFQTEVGKYDAPSHSYQVGNSLSPGSLVLTVLPGSDLYQTRPWKGWKSFHAAITEDNFKEGLRALAAQSATGPTPGLAPKISSDPADYRLLEWHLNAELQSKSAPAEMGWSMKGARITQVSADRLKELELP